jgi:hypothetical protein
MIMRKLYFFTLLFFGFNYTFAQVGINTTTPDAQLDIKASNQATPNNTDGILIPRVDAFPATAPTVTQQGMMVYLTTLSGTNQPGFYYWDNNSTTWKAIGGATNAWNINGNAGTNPATNFIGTTDATPFIFKTNNVISGRIGGNTSFGYYSLQSATGINNNDNSAFGVDALRNSIGARNSAFGAHAMYYNSGFGGDDNVAFGNSTLYSNIGGYRNIAVGNNALYNNSYGYENMAIGYDALKSNISGNYNIAIGKESLFNNVMGGANIAIGYRALYNVNVNNPSSGSSNISIGDLSLNNCLSCKANIAIGNGTATQGDSNILIGIGATNSGSLPNRSIAIGNDALVLGEDKLSIGNVIFGNTIGYNYYPNSRIGLIGIAERDPTAKLHIAAKNENSPEPSDGIIIPRINTFSSTNPFATNNGMMVFLTTAVGTKQPGFYYWDNLTTTWKSIIENNNFWLANGTHVYKNTGNVGIGTNTPSEKLDIAGKIKITDGSEGVGKILTSDATGVGTWQPATSSSFWTKSGANVFPTSISDNIGINTSTPTSALNVNGQITIDQKNFGGYGGLLIKGNAPGNNYPNIAFSIKNTSGLDAVSGYIGGHINNNVTGSEAMDLVFLTSQNGLLGLSEKMRIKDDGNVTIAGKILNEAWQTPTLLNTWVNYGPGFNTPQYYIDKESVVHLKGLVKNGAVGTVIFTLPVGYRPTEQYIFTVNSGGAFGRVDVAAYGDVIVVTGNSSWVSLDGISFRVN